MSYTQNVTILDPRNQTRQMSEKYQMMDTEALVNEFLSMNDGTLFELHPTKGIYYHKNRKTGEIYAPHYVRLRVKTPVVDGDVYHYELRIRNSYDGTCAFEVTVGIFRLVCGNGLVIPVEQFSNSKVRHIGTPSEEAMNIARTFAQQLPELTRVRNSFKKCQLTHDQQITFAKKAFKLRKNEDLSSEDAQRLLEVTRIEDAGNSLWVVFNRIQEKLMNGGFKSEGMKKAQRGINDANVDLSLNRKLFELAYQYVDNTTTIEAEEVVEDVQIPTKPNKYVYEGSSRNRRANPEYAKWMELYGDLV